MDQPEGAMQGCIALAKAAGCPFRQPHSKVSAHRVQAASGGISLGYFSLAKHKFAWSEFEQPTAGPKGENQGMVFVAKVTRPSVREPTSKESVAPATQILERTHKNPDFSVSKTTAPTNNVVNATIPKAPENRKIYFINNSLK